MKIEQIEKLRETFKEAYKKLEFKEDDFYILIGSIAGEKSSHEDNEKIFKFSHNIDSEKITFILLTLFKVIIEIEGLPEFFAKLKFAMFQLGLDYIKGQETKH